MAKAKIKIKVSDSGIVTLAASGDGYATLNALVEVLAATICEASPNWDFAEIMTDAAVNRLYDLVDDHDETLDVTGLPICLITDVILPAPLEQSFPEFWENWIDSGTGFESELDSVFFLNTVGSCVYLPVILWGGE